MMNLMGKILKIKFKPRLIDFQWYYSAFAALNTGYKINGWAFDVASLLSKTFNLYLLTSVPKNKYKRLT